MKLPKFIFPVLLAAILSMPVTVFAAFEGLAMMRMGAWEVDFSGNVNSFYIYGECDPDVDGQTVAHGLSCGSGGRDKDYVDVRDGLLPSWFNFSAATTTDGGIRTAVHLSFQPGSNTNSGLTEALDGALGQGSVNFRQVFFTFGHESWGTIKIGRDLGLFGSDAILNDMTLLGVGSGADNSKGHTTLGRIGVGYPYADWKAQVQYTTPNLNGFTFTAALVQPWGASGLAGSFADEDCRTYRERVGNKTAACGEANGTDVPFSASDGSAGGQEEDTYGIEAKVNYAFEGEGMSGLLWASYIRQEVDFENALKDDPAGIVATNTPWVGDGSADADGFDIGAKIAMGGFDLVGYYYDGEGIGTTSFLLDGVDILGDERDSDGWYLQGRYRFPTGTLLGVSVGESNLDESDYDKARLAADDTYNLVETNESWIVGLYHPVGEALNLVVEYVETESEAHNGYEGDEEMIAIGGIMFF